MRKRIKIFVAVGLIAAAMFVQQAYASTVTAEISNISSTLTVGGANVVLSDVAWTSADGSGTMANGTFTLSSSNEEVLSCGENNICKGVKAGVANLTAKANDGSVTATKEITVVEGNAAPTISRVGDKSLNIGPDGKQLSVTTEPDDIAVTWASSNTKIATVNSKGYVKAVAFGTVTISAAAEDGTVAEWKVTVNKLKVSMKESSSKNIKSYIKNIKNYKKGKWSKGDNTISVSDDKIKTSAFKKGSKSVKTRKLIYKVGKKSYMLTVSINCKHSYVKNSSYLAKCKKKTNEYYNEYLMYNRTADNAWGDSRIFYLDKAIAALDNSIMWNSRFIANYYICEKCGKTKSGKA